MAEIAFTDDLKTDKSQESLSLPPILLEVVDFCAKFLEARFSDALAHSDPIVGTLKNPKNTCGTHITQSIRIDINAKNEQFLKSFKIFLKRFLFTNSSMSFNFAKGSVRLQSDPKPGWGHFDDLSPHHSEDMLLVLCYAKKSRLRNARHLDLIAQRIQYLYPEANASLNNNPIDPLNFLKAFLGTCNALHFNAAEKDLLFQYFDLKVCRKFTDLFKCINQIFLSHDVLKDLEEQGDSRTNASPKKLIPQKVILNKRQNHQEILTSQVIVSILKAYHERNAVKFSERTTPVIIDFHKIIHARVKRINKLFSANFASERDLLILYRTRRYFEQIFADPSLPKLFKAQISRLQTVFAIQALKDPTLLSNSSHFLRKLLKSMHQQTFDWVDTNDLTHIPAERTRHCIDEICFKYPSHSKKIADLAESFVVESNINNKISLVEKRTLQTESGRHRLQEANSEVCQYLSDFFRGKYITQALERFIDGAWRPYMVLLFLREGLEGSTWKANMEKMNTLLKPFNTRHKEKLVSEYNKGIKDLRIYIESIFDHMNTSLDKKRQYSRCLHPINAKDIKPYRHFFSDELEGPRIKLPFQLAKTILKLKRGTWLDYYDDQGIQHRVQYLCPSEGASALVFLCRHGQPLQAIALSKLGRLKEAKRLKFLSDLELSCTL